MSILLVTTVLLLQGESPDWPAFRGGSHSAVSSNKLPDKWSTTENVAWVVDVPGLAWSSPVVKNGKIYLTTAIPEGKTDLAKDAKKGLYFGGERTKPEDRKYRYEVMCIDEATGKEVWKQMLEESKPDRGIHVKNTYASETPVIEEDRLYVMFGNLLVAGLDLNGKVLWKYKLPSMDTTMSWGPAASPTAHQGKVYVVCDNNKESFIVCIDGKTGSEMWKKPRGEKSNWATPFVWTNSKRTEIVTAGTKQVCSYDLDGNVLWTLSGMSTITVPTPFAVGDSLLVSSGYVMDSKKPVYFVKPGASGDISLKDGKTSNDYITWSQPTAASYMPTPVVYDGLCYILYDMGTLACYDVKDGKEVYSKQRLGTVSGYTVSPWAYDGKIFCLNEDGDTVVVQAGREFKKLGKNKLDELCMASPAMTDKSLLIRTAGKLYCIRK